jgi:hypothetical protein
MKWCTNPTDRTAPVRLVPPIGGAEGVGVVVAKIRRRRVRISGDAG